MSILRYNPNPLWWWLAFQTHDKGKFCEYRDYVKLEAENARLKAEVERLTAIVGADAIDREHGMCCDASAQVERLTKAGDAMAVVINLNDDVFDDYEKKSAQSAWQDAKEGNAK